MAPLEVKKKKSVLETHEESEEDKPYGKEKENATLSESLIDQDFIMRINKRQILEERKNHGELSNYIKLTYPCPKKNVEHDEEFQKFMELLTNLQINISLAEALEKVSFYAKFIKEILS